MRQALITTLLLLTIVISFSQNQATFRADRDTVAERQIKNLEYYLTELLGKKDIDTYSGYLTDDDIRVNASAAISTKEQVLDMFRKAPTQGGKMSPHDLDVRVYGNTAILRAILDIETKTGDIITKRTSIITKVFIKRDGKWYMASLQGTAVN